MRFEWDVDKERINRAKHGTSFSTARQVFDDPLLVSSIDDRSELEERWITIGTISGDELVAVVHTYRELNGETAIRIISARKASRNERKHYERGT